MALKQTLVKVQVLSYPNLNLPYLLDIDGSAECVGAILSRIKEGKE